MKDKENKKITNKIKVERAKKAVTQQELAEKIKISRQAINRIEKGDSEPSGRVMLKIAQFFGKKVEKIFRLEDED